MLYSRKILFRASGSVWVKNFGSQNLFEKNFARIVFFFFLDLKIFDHLKRQTPTIGYTFKERVFVLYFHVCFVLASCSIDAIPGSEAFSSSTVVKHGDEFWPKCAPGFSPSTWVRFRCDHGKITGAESFPFSCYGKSVHAKMFFQTHVSQSNFKVIFPFFVIIILLVEICTNCFVIFGIVSFWKFVWS